MGIFRSEDMGLFDIAIPKDSAWEIMNELGRLDCLHFNDSNADVQVFNLTFASTIRRCDEAQRRIKYIEDECRTYEIKLTPPSSPEQFMINIDRITRMKRKAASTLLEEFETDLIQKEKFIMEQTRKFKEMQENANYLIEYKYVLSKAIEIIYHRRRHSEENKAGEPKLPIRRNSGNEALLPDIAALGGEFSLSYIAGVINQEETLRLKKLVFRATRGNALSIVEDLGKSLLDIDGVAAKKSVYVIIFKEGAVLRDKLNKICDSFLGDRFDIPNSGIDNKINDITAKIEETKTLMEMTKAEIRNYLVSINRSTDEIAGASVVLIQKWFIRKEKALYHALNKLRLEASFFRGSVWCPLTQEPRVQNIISGIKQNRNIVGPQLNRVYSHDEVPPTYFKLNEFTFAFQEIVNTYGMPTYKEANPGLFAIVSFPFLFGVMFGDIGHGFMLLLASIYLCFAKENLERSKSLLGALLPVRYLLLLMAVFATFNGFIYNDFVSIPVDIFGTCYENVGETAIRLDENCVYPIGIDPKWYVASNELTFMNSFKMKVAVILGVLQMSIGVCLKASNAIYFRRPLDFFFVFVPQIIFLVGVFGYMDFMIVFKWLTDWSDPDKRPPSIITTLVNIPLAMGDVGDEPLWGDGSAQQSLHIAILIVAFICVPLMLFPKPLIQRSMHMKKLAEEEESRNLQLRDIEPGQFPKRKHFDDESAINEEKSLHKNTAETEKKVNKGGGHGHGHEYNFGEEFIHQLIETIEFVLGTISNTASYLRLWALSLAHAQLANVFFSKTMKDGVMSGNILGIFIGYYPFINFTFGVLMCMDVLECFLHTLRLHWVEFQNKFYEAKGYRFLPFSFDQVLKEVDN